MLVLERKVGESIRVGDNIVIKVTATKGNRVTVAVEAPKDVRVQRFEKTTP